MKISIIFLRLFQFIVLTILFAVIYMLSSAPLAPFFPPIPSDSGLFPSPIDFLFVSATQALVIMTLLLSSKWYCWKLALATSFSFYGVTTIMSQIETRYFLSDLTLPEGLLQRMFLSGVPTAFVFIPFAVFILWKIKKPTIGIVYQPSTIPVKQWVAKLVVLGFIYLLLYFSAGYFIAWRNPDVRAFYNGIDHANFWMSISYNWKNDPILFLFQFVRGFLWIIFALPVLRMTRGSVWSKAFMVGLLLGVPMNIGHILSNPLIPSASVRLSHMIETSTSTFIFGLAIVWLLHRSHHSVADVFGISKIGSPRPVNVTT
ncbi:MAG: hypothetical protein IH585_10220 [Anaerolineaceae bacterium]|nr:hypothetical protein [Anaerolineaceae bacterium]